MWCDLRVSGLEELSREELVELTRRLVARVEELTRANAELTEQVARLERLAARVVILGRWHTRVLAVTRDQPPAGQPAADEPGQGGRRRGKQKGAPGANLAWSSTPDDTVPHRPTGVCECGQDLSAARDLGVYASHQQVDIPLVTAKVTQHDRHAAACGCGRMHVAQRPEQVPDASVSYGPNLVAWCVYLMVAHAIPVARCADLVEALTGTRPSDGFVHGLIGRAAAAVAQVNQIIRTLVTWAHVVAADETPIRVGPKRAKKYLLVACTDLYTWYLLGDRDLETFKAFVLPDLTGVIVHDRYGNYDSKTFGHLVHQLCCQHLIRDCTDAAETYPDAVWPTQIRDALQELIHQANLARAAGLDRIPPEIADPIIDRYRHGVLVGLKEVPRQPGRTQLKHRALLEALHNRRDDILRFVTDLRIPPTSNQAERDLRPAKTQQKISGRLTSETVTEHRYAIRGYISTVAKHGADIMTAIRDALAGQPWTPPAWAPG